MVAFGVISSFSFLCITLCAVACAQFEKIKAGILDIRQQQFTPDDWQEDEQVHIIANRDLQAKLNACIRHHQDIMT
jgi:hypothetical protein